MRFDRNLLSILAVLTLALLLAGGEAWAGGKRGGGGKGAGRSGDSHREVTRTGSGGNARTWSQDRSAQRGKGRYESQTTRTNPSGASRTKHSVG